MLRAYTRVAVVQLAYHPALLVQRRSPLSDPLFEHGRPDSLLPESGDVPAALRPELDALRRRVREAYGAQILERVRAILTSLRALNVRVAVFPEHSIPWEILRGVADAAGEIVVVAGSHSVERAALRSGIYEQLGVPSEALPEVGREVCPVLYGRRLLSLQAALGAMKPGASEWEAVQGEDVTALSWAPLAMPDGIPGPMGVLPYFDFIHRDMHPFREALEGPLKACRFLALPSVLLPTAATGAKVWAEAKRFGKPVLHAAGAKSGGTSVFVDEWRGGDLRLFPDHAGHLESGDEGVIVADVDLSYKRLGQSAGEAGDKAVRPVAEATLVYRAHPVGDSYAQWLEETAPLLEKEGGAAALTVIERVEAARDLLLNAGALSGAKARDRRLRRMLDEIDNLTGTEELRQFTREIVLPPGVLPQHALRAAMARGAADKVFAWLKLAGARAAGFGEVEARLRGESERIVSEASSWTRAGMEAFGAVSQAVRGSADAEMKPPPPSEAGVRIVLPAGGVDPAALGTKRCGGFAFDFRSRPDDFRVELRREKEEAQTRHPSRARDRGASKEADSGSFQLDFSEAHLWVADELYLLAIAEGAERVSVVGMRPEKSAARSGRTFEAEVLLVLSSAPGRDGWIAREAGRSPWLITKWARVRAALAEAGMESVELDEISAADYPSRIFALLPRYDGARAVIEALLTQRLREVSGQFVAPDVLVGASQVRQSILDALDTWLASDEQTALVLGEFGAGKSTALSAWARRRWELGTGPRPILVSLAAASRAMDAEGLLLEAARARDTRQTRAALRILIRRRLILPCFDGFDEMATRLDASDLAGRLSSLLEVARGGGQVIITSRDNYFPTEEQLQTTTEGALMQALGASAGLRRLVIQPFNEAQVRSLVEKIRGEAKAAEEALAKIAQTYDLRDLVRRPLLLGMVLATLDQIEPGSKVGTADLYEAYLMRWLEQTRSGDPECFTDEQKIEFAESLAEQLWRSGRATCSWKELQESVRARLAQYLPHDVPHGAAFLEIQGGSFFVREGEDRFRFAHKSFLEYFAARGIVFAAPERPKEALTTKPITPELASFVGEILRRQGRPRDSMAVRRVQAWLVGEMVEAWAEEAREGGASARADAPSGTAVPAANAARLLLELGRWAKERGGWIPEGADLRGVRMAGEDLRGASLVRAHLEDAHLSGADLRGVDLTGARLDGARLNGAKLSHAVLRGASARGTDFIQAEAHEADLSGADLTGALLRQSMWTDCQLDNVSAEGADVTGWLAPGCRGALASLSACSVSSSSHAATLATGRSRRVFSVAWNPDGIRLAMSGKHAMVRIWDTQTSHDVAHLYGHSRSVNSIAWHADGIRLATASNDGTLRIWSAATGEEIALKNGKRALAHVAWHPDGVRLVTAGIDGFARIWSVGSRDELARYEVSTGDIWTAEWDPSGARLACSGKSGAVHILDAESGAELSVIRHTGEIGAVQWSPGGDRIASLTSQGTVVVWDIEGSSEVARFELNRHATWALHIHPDGKRIACGAQDGVRVFDIDTSKELAYIKLQEVVTVAWSPDGAQLAIGTSDEGTRLWDFDSSKERARAEEPPARFTTVAWRSSDTQCASAGHDGVVRLWSATSGQEVARVEHDKEVRLIALHPRLSQFASASRDTIYLWDIDKNCEILRIKQAEGAPMEALVWHPNGAHLASSGRDSTLLWSVESGQPILAFSKGGPALACRPGGDRLAIATAADTVCVLSIETGEQITERPSPGRIRAITWSPSGDALAVLGENGLEVQSNASGERVLLATTPDRWFHAAAWHPQGALLATAKLDGSVWLWDIEARKDVARLENAADRAAWSIDWSRDGSRIAVAGDFGVHLWDVAGRRLLCSFEALHKSVLARTPGGFCVFGGGDPDRYRLGLRRPGPEPRTRLYLPLGGLRQVLQRPDKVAAALAGDLDGDDLQPELGKVGFDNGVRWDGKAQRVPDAPPREEGVRKPLPEPPRLPSPASAPSASSVPAAPAALAALAAPAHALKMPAGAVVSMSAPAGAPAAAPPPPRPEALIRRDAAPPSPPAPPYEKDNRAKRSIPPRQLAQQATSPAQIQNPFRPGPALTDAETLPGRELVINELLSLIDGKSPAVLRGPRRAGKTSILHSIEKRLLAREEARPVRRITLEASHIVVPDDLARVIDPSLKLDAAPADTLRARLREGKRSTILLDEVANLKGADPSVFAWLRAVGQEEASVIFAGSFWDWVLVVERASAAPGSSFGNDVTPVSLGPIPRADAIRFLVDNAPPDVPIEEDRTARWIIELCGTWPFYLQVLGHAVVQAVRAGSRAALVERPGVSELYEQKLLVDRDPVFRGRWAELPERARRVLRPLPAMGISQNQAARLPAYNDLPRDDRKALRDTGLCTPLGAWLDDPPFFDWVRRSADDHEGGSDSGSNVPR